MSFTVENIINSIALMLSGKWSIPVYASPNQQGTKYPCFFVFLMPSNMGDEVDDRYKREIHLDVVYVQARNIPNAYMDIYEKAEGLDELFDMIQYTDGTDTAPLHTHEREYSIEDQELHYKFKVMARTTLPYTPTPMQIMESEDVSIKES